MKKLILTFGIAIAFFIVNDAVAQEVNNVPNQTDARQKVQRARIAEGIASGDVTRMEAKRLRTEQRAIRRTERRVEADGVVTGREQRRLNKMQNQASRDIRRQKNDLQRRGN